MLTINESSSRPGCDAVSTLVLGDSALAFASFIAESDEEQSGVLFYKNKALNSRVSFQKKGSVFSHITKLCPQRSRCQEPILHSEHSPLLVCLLPCSLIFFSFGITVFFGL